MKLSRPAAVFAAVVLLAGGAAMAVNAATTTNPVALCSNDKTGVLTAPSSTSGNCARGSTKFTVGSSADVQALAGRVDTAEGRLTALETSDADHDAEIAALRNDVDGLLGGELTVQASSNGGVASTFRVSFSGVRLQPGSYVIFQSGFGGVPFANVVASDGTFFGSRITGCGMDAYATGVSVDGDPVESDHISTGPDCP
jgi:hypothetical protein